MTLKLIVHRGTHEIGGNCIEIAHPRGDRIILDAGRPLDEREGADWTVACTFDRSLTATVLISHPHQDHWGLINEIPASWPIWTGSKSARLIAIAGDITRRPLVRAFETWNSRARPFAIGPFIVTPILTDHSAFDDYMLLIEEAEKRILYTGDFRRDGRKSSCVDKMIAKPPADVDVLLTEGTNLGSDKPVKAEKDLEYDFAELFKRTKGRVFVSWSGQNIDRTVTIYRAAKRTGRTLAIDLYTADILDRIAASSRLPRAGLPNLKVVITTRLRCNYRKQGREEFIERIARAGRGISAKRLEGGRDVIMLRRALLGDYQRAGVVPTADDAYNFSMWRGYLSDPYDSYYSAPLEWLRAAGAEVAYIHTSGHASPSDLRAFTAAVRPKIVVPVHGVKWDEESHGFGMVRRLADGEAMEVP